MPFLPLLSNAKPVSLSMATRKPLVVALGDPKYAGQEFLDEFKKDFDFEVLLGPFFVLAASSHATDTARHKP